MVLMALTLDPKTTAVFFMDLQNGIMSRFGEHGADAVLDRAAGVLAAARKAGVFVGFVRVGFRPGHPEVGDDHPIFGYVRKNDMLVLGRPDAEIHEKVKPRDDEPVVTKHRVGPFLGTDLEQILRARGVKTLVMRGIATSGVILSAVRYAADADFQLVVAEDGCLDSDEEVHRVLMTKVFPRMASVIKCAELVAAL
jgi:nicotinamidase-related amidase